MRQIWFLALDCLTTKHEIILISYKFFHIKAKAYIPNLKNSVLRLKGKAIN